MPLVIEGTINKSYKGYRSFSGYRGYGSYVEYGTVKRGHTGPRVVKLQTLLMSAGYALPKYGADGVFGAETETAVRAFQRNNGLIADGQVGVKTWAALTGVAVSTPVPTIPTVPTVPTPPVPTLKPIIDLKKYLPYILIGGGLLIITIYLLKRK